MPQRTIRLSDKTAAEIDSAARSRGFNSSTAFIRYAIEQELVVRKEDLTGTEDRLAASVEQVRLRIPGEGERDSGIKPNSIPG